MAYIHFAVVPFHTQTFSAFSHTHIALRPKTSRCLSTNKSSLRPPEPHPPPVATAAKLLDAMPLQDVVPRSLTHAPNHRSKCRTRHLAAMWIATQELPSRKPKENLENRCFIGKKMKQDETLKRETNQSNLRTRS